MPDPRGSTTWLENAAARAPRRAALIDAAGVTVSYAELLERARVAAPALAGAEAGPVALELEPGIEHAVAVHAAILAGRPLLTVRPGLPETEREEVLAAGAPALVWGSEGLVARPDRGERPSVVSIGAGEGRSARLDGVEGVEAVEGADGDEGAVIVARVLSSGTTGPRRPVDLSSGNFAASAAASAANLGVEPEDVWLACLPMDHVGGLSILIRSAIYGTTALIHSRFDVDAVSAALAAEAPRVSGISLVPTQLRRLLDAGAPLHRLRFALIGGAALDPVTLDAALDAGAPVVQSYGLTQACSQVCTLAPGEAREHRGSSGRALAGIEVRIGETGEIEVRGAVVAAGAAGADGWLRTGDLGRIDADGYLWVEGRADDTIVSGGENVRPEPVEKQLESHPAVAEAAVVGRPDAEWGEAVTAVVVPAAGAEPTAAELIAHCREAMAPAMVPKRVELVAALPRTASGKLQRARLRA